MSDDTSGWDSSVAEWTVDTGTCCAGALANGCDGCRFFGVAVQDCEDPWGTLAKSGYEIDVFREDGSVEKQVCDESETIRQAIMDGKAPDGVWIGGQKYKLTNFEKDFDSGGNLMDIAQLARVKGGGHLIKTPKNTVIVVLYDEEKDQNKISSRMTALSYADHLIASGF